jgi:hypothetical protein
MPLETAVYINELNETYPEVEDDVSQGEDHIRIIKGALKRTWPNIAGPVLKTHTQLNATPHNREGIAALLGANPVLIDPSQISGGANRLVALAIHGATGRLRWASEGLAPAGGVVLDNEFTGGNQGRFGNGWQIFPGGFRVMWGSFSVNMPGSEVSVAFQAAFPAFFNQVVQVMATPANGNGGGHITCTVEGWNTQTFSGFVNSAAPGGRSFRWLAFGF